MRERAGGEHRSAYLSSASPNAASNGMEQSTETYNSGQLLALTFGPPANASQGHQKSPAHGCHRILNGDRSCRRYAPGDHPPDSRLRSVLVRIRCETPSTHLSNSL